jgi:hypothetical protein
MTGAYARHVVFRAACFVVADTRPPAVQKASVLFPESDDACRNIRGKNIHNPILLYPKKKSLSIRFNPAGYVSHALAPCNIDKKTRKNRPKAVIFMPKGLFRDVAVAFATGFPRGPFRAAEPHMASWGMSLCILRHFQDSIRKCALNYPRKSNEDYNRITGRA